MEKTLFAEYVEKYFHGFVGAVMEKFNGAAAESPYLHKTLLREEYSADLRWGSTDINHSVVAADVVSLESSLPLKSRAAVSRASGTIPKLGIKMRKGEIEISNINVMRAKGASEAEVAARVFDDVAKVIKAIDVRKEIMFQSALSTGQCLVTDAENVGTGVRASFGYLPKNTVKSAAKWEDAAAAKPIDDLRGLFGAADARGVTPLHVYLSRKYFDYLRASAQGRLFGAQAHGVLAAKPEMLVATSVDAMLMALRNEFGAEFHVVNGSYRVEQPSGRSETVKPWAEANVVAVPEATVGRLVYGTLAEETNPASWVAYQKAGSHVLVSKFSQVDPLEEYTTAQALCLPVIDGAGDIFTLQADQTK